jgi:uncharacterized protein YdeI (BOF family)
MTTATRRTRRAGDAEGDAPASTPLTATVSGTSMPHRDAPFGARSRFCPAGSKLQEAPKGGKMKSLQGTRRSIRGGRPMKIALQRSTFCGILSLLLALASCGGERPGEADGGTGVGPISGFGSVIVNGIDYSTDNANIVISGSENRPETELKVGMRVRVDGSFSGTENIGRAMRIELIREVHGPMDDNGVDNVSSLLHVAGQAVLVDPATIFDNVADLAELQAIQAGTVHHPEVEAHGAQDDNGAIHATYIRKGSDDFRLTDNVSIRGKMKNFNATLRTFTIGGQKVTYPLVGLERVPPGAIFRDDIFVDVRGLLNAAGGTGTLTASRIEVLDNTVGENNDPVRLEGYVVSGTTKRSFVILGPGGTVSVDGVGATVIPSTGTIEPGRKVQVEGAIAGKILKATEIRVRSASSIRVEDKVWPSQDNTQIPFHVLLNLPVEVDAYTRFKDSVGVSPDRTFGLAKLSANDNVRVVGSYDGSKVTATLVERIDPADPGLVLLQGPVESFQLEQLNFYILGMQVTSVKNFTNTEFHDGEGNTVSASDFFTVVLPNLRTDQVVKVKRGVFYVESTPLIRDDDPTRKMEVGVERINN